MGYGMGHVMIATHLLVHVVVNWHMGYGRYELVQQLALTLHSELIFKPNSKVFAHHHNAFHQIQIVLLAISIRSYASLRVWTF